LPRADYWYVERRAAHPHKGPIFSLKPPPLPYKPGNRKLGTADLCSRLNLGLRCEALTSLILVNACQLLRTYSRSQNRFSDCTADLLVANWDPDHTEMR
jgi:hypothetical protein